MKFHVKGSIRPPRGTPGANGAYSVDLEIETPKRVARLVTMVGYVMARRSRLEIPGDVAEWFAVALERAMREEA